MNLRALKPAQAIAAALAVAVAIQFVPVSRVNPPARYELSAPADVKRVLERSCYDCHSVRTRWPWYSRVAPVSWLVARDVQRGRRELDFTDWPVADPGEEADLLEHVARQVERGRMPMPIYITLHGDARLSRAERARLIEWARSSAAARGPGDGTEDW